MLSKEWWIEHFVEVISVIVSVIGFFVAGKYLVKITKNQKMSAKDINRSSILQAGGDINIKEFKHEIKGAIATSEPLPEKEEDPKKLIKKIEDYLDDNKPISLIADMSLRLARKLKMKEDEIWLEKEVNGYDEYLDEDYTKTGLKMKKKGKEDEHRRVNSELTVQVNNEKIETFKIPMFISQSIKRIEDLANQDGQLVQLTAPPMEIMVSTLKISPTERVPYLINLSEFKKIIDELRQKIISFLERAKTTAKN